MDDYIMGCCDCGLQHRVKFRAIQVTKKLENGEFEYTELDPKLYRVELTMWRHSDFEPIKWTDGEIEAMEKRGWQPYQCKVCGESAGAIQTKHAEK